MTQPDQTMTARAVQYITLAAGALEAVEGAEMTADSFTRLMPAVLKRCEAEDELRERGLNPSLADVEWWLALTSRQKRDVALTYDVWQMTGVIRDDTENSPAKTPENPS